MVLEARALEDVDTSYLDKELLDAGGRLRLRTAAELNRHLQNDLLLWCNRRCRYGLPTVELVDFLREAIGGRSAIEIGAGMGDLGRLLGIPMTDSHSQTLPELRRAFAALKQPVIEPPSDVEKLDAVEAVKKYRPQVVIASWVTQLYQPGDEREPIVGSSVHGVDEIGMLRHIETYIHIGNEAVHQDKRAISSFIKGDRCVAYKMPWLVSRAFQASRNCIWIWGPHTVTTRVP